jgi:hypothetical protein
VNPGGDDEDSVDDSLSESDDEMNSSGDESPGFGPTSTYGSGTWTTGLPETTGNPRPSTINAGPFPEFMDEQRQAQYYHHRQVETALTVIGSLGEFPPLS